MKLKRLIQTDNSLRARIIISALLLSLVLLPIIGVALKDAFSQQVRENVKDQLNAYFYSILAVTEFENTQLLMPDVLLDNQFNLINSGYYALITNAPPKSNQPVQEPNILWFSNSFLGTSVNSELPIPEVGNSKFGEVLVNQQGHFIYSYTVRFEIASIDNDTDITNPSVTLHIIRDMQSIEQQQHAFSQTLFTWFLILIGVFILIQLFWLTWTLKPLAKFSEELKSVQTGNQEHLSLQHPNELKQVAKQINVLLNNEKQQRTRYRNALSDLAHSLKTPLAVLQSQQDLSTSSIEQINNINRTINYQLKRAQSSSNQAWHKGIEIVPVCEKLVRTLKKIYPTTNIVFENKADIKILFMGDENDLTEMLGNLLDNACKAAKSEVTITIIKHQTGMEICIEDDGKGVSFDQRDTILERGKRLDTYEQGHGIGLSIVQDLVSSYQGKLTLGTSNSLDGAKFTVTFDHV